MWLTALSVQYRDINYGMGFLIQLLMYAAPVVYPASSVPEQYRLLYALNPMVGVIEGFRSALLGTNPMPWDFIAVGSMTAILIAISANDEIWIDRQERDPRAVRGIIESLHAENPKGSIVIQADKESTNEMLVIIMEAAKGAGVKNVAIASDDG